jgi:NAD(P)-dependent dehydrogenase (short-subunit alcohol dehydrogenase family)
MEFGLKGKRALVLAASRGLGYASAMGLAREGCKLVICSRDQARIEAAAGAIRTETGAEVQALVADVSSGAEAKRLEAIAQSGESSASWSGAETTPEALARFREEMNAARAAWAKARGEAPPAGASTPSKPPSLGADADQFTDDEVDRLFIDAQLKIARDQIRSGQKDKARATLEGVLKDFPKAKAAQEAKTLLDGLK